MKKILSLICAAAFCAAIFTLIPMTAFASEITGSCGDDITYVYDTDTKVLTLTGTGSSKDYASYGSNRNPFIQNTSMKLATSVVVGEGITRLGNYLFNGLNQVESITLPSTLTAIGNNSVAGMQKVTAVALPEGLQSIGEYAFQSWRGLTSLTLPSTLQSIGNSAFSGCSSVPSLTVPGSVKTIGSYVFNGWTSLTDLTIEEGVETIGSQAFCSTQITEANIPASVMSLQFNSFDGNNDLAAYHVAEGNPNYRDVEGVLYSKDLTVLLRCPDAYSGAYEIAEGCTAISPSAFQYCAGVTAVVIPEGVTSIGANAFEGTSITALTTPGTLASLEAGAFYGCTTLETVVVNGSLTELPQNAFNGCSSLVSVTLSPGITSIGSGAFGYCSSLSDVTLPASLTAIPDNCFSYCSSLSSIDIPGTVTSIGSGAFDQCSGLTGVVLPEGLVSLGGSAFRGTAITSVTVPAGVTVINGTVFTACPNLTEIDFLGEITSVGSVAQNCPNLVKVTFHCAPMDPNYANEYAFNNANKDFEIHYPNIYPEWATERPFDGKYKQYTYVADLYASEVRMDGVELRERPYADGKQDMRFIAMITPVEGCEISARYIVLTCLSNGNTITVDCPNTWRVDEDGTIVFTAVLTGIKPKYFDQAVSAQAFLELTGKWQGTMKSNTVSASVNDLMGQD